MKKIRKRKIAALSAAFAMCISICPSFAVSVYAEGTVSNVVSDAKALPEWVPTDFCSALDFVREHGSTYVEDNVVCIVKKTDKYDLYRTDISPEYSDDVIVNESYRFEEEENSAVYDEYLEYLPDISYEVMVIAPSKAGEFDVSLVRSYENGKEAERKDLSFEASGDKVTETDVYAWLPDCDKEYYAFLEENGVISVIDGFVVFCDQPCYDGGYTWNNTQDGTGRMKCVMDKSITEDSFMPLPPGSAPNEMLLYTPSVPGTVEMTWGAWQTWDSDSYSFLGEACFKLNDDGSIEIIDSSEVKYPIYGDCNNDGNATLMDMVVLHKWLQGTGKLSALVNADINKDGKVNIFDFAELKRVLTLK